MTIKELIAALQKVENQDEGAYVYADGASYKIVSVDDDGDNYNLLCEEIEELLAQPEQVVLKLHGSAAMEVFNEQKPVGIVITIGGYPDDSEHTVKLTCRHRDLKDGDFLYASPQKRGSLSDERLLDISNSINATYDFGNVSVWQAFYIARLIEKAHGIGE